MEIAEILKSAPPGYWLKPLPLFDIFSLFGGPVEIIWVGHKDTRSNPVIFVDGAWREMEADPA